AKFWTQQLLLHGAAEDRGLVENTAAADVYTLAGDGPVPVLHRPLCRLGAANRADPVGCLPYPLPAGCPTGHALAPRPERALPAVQWLAPRSQVFPGSRRMGGLGESVRPTPRPPWPPRWPMRWSPGTPAREIRRRSPPTGGLVSARLRWPRECSLCSG